METLDAESLSPNKRPKIVPEIQTLNPQISPSSSKGKSPIFRDDEDNDADESPAELSAQNCGICFSDQGKSVRGLIDCCDHYFCFLCVIEWSKIESRCPLCRGRFSTVRRVRKDGTAIGDGYVRIPVRDQFYDPFNEPTDPYAHARCTVCDGTSDESLLLLCDLCDSALHTYCVGLGFTVPEGDWFCQDCTLLRAEQHDSEMNDSVDNSNDNSSTNPKHLDEESSINASISIFDIVRDPPAPLRAECGVDRLRKLVSPTKKFSCSTNISDHANIAPSGSSRDVTDSSARTLRNCRNVRKHINVLRDNWDAFRTGSLGFSSGLVGPSRKGGGKTSLLGKHTGSSCDSHSSLNQSSSQSKEQGTSGNSTCRKNPYDVEKAWKLMNIAKSMKSASKTAKSVNVAANRASFKAGIQSPSENLRERVTQTSGNHRFSGSFPETATTSYCKPQNSSISRLSLSKVQTPSLDDIYRGHLSSSSTRKPVVETSNISSTELKKKEIDYSLRKQVWSADNYWSREAMGRGPTKNISSTSYRPIARNADIPCMKLCNKEININSQKQLEDADNCRTREADLRNPAQADINHRADFPSLSKDFDKCNGAVCSTFPDLPEASGFGASCGKSRGENVPTSLSKVGSKVSGGVSKNIEAKGEIQSLVKLNLKLLSKDKRLGADAFKDIARLSTHTILAACGFEHRRIASSCPTLVCHHTDQIHEHRRCTLMPSSCRECFYLFVNNVVNSIMSEKLTGSAAAQ